MKNETNGYYAGMDVHQRTTSLCLMDGRGAVVREWKIRTAPKELDEPQGDLARQCGETPVTLGLEASTAGSAVFRHLRRLGRSVVMAYPKALRAVTPRRRSPTRTTRVPWLISSESTSSVERMSPRNRSTASAPWSDWGKNRSTSSYGRRTRFDLSS